MNEYLSRFTFFLGTLLIIHGGFAQIPQWNLAASSTCTSTENGNSVCTDAAGNVYVTGHYYNSSIVFGSYTLSNNGNYDVFVVKYDPMGNVLWAKNAGGVSDDIGMGIQADHSGNVYVFGYYYSPTIVAGTNTLFSNGTGDVFLIKYNSVGNVVWAKSYGNGNEENGLGLALDNSDNPIICGFFGSNTLVLDTYTINNSGANDGFVAKISSAGVALWAYSFGSNSLDQATAVATDATGNCYVTGVFSSTLSAGALTLASQGSTDIFVLKINSSGTEAWLNGAGGNLNEMGNAIALDNTGNVIVVSDYYSSPVTAGTNTFNSAGGKDMLLMKLDPAGNFVWSRSMGDVQDETGTGVVVDSNSDIYVTGHVHSPNLVVGAYTLGITGFGDFYVNKYSSSGNVAWSQNTGGNGDEGTSAIAIDLNGNIIVTGFFNSPVITLSSYTLTNSGMEDVLLARLQGMVTGGSVVNKENFNMLLYPNPGDGKFTFIRDSELHKLTITDMEGKSSDLPFTDSGDCIHVSAILPSGIYIVKAEFEGRLAFARLSVH